jgi:hypothetical protein
LSLLFPLCSLVMAIGRNGQWLNVPRIEGLN